MVREKFRYILLKIEGLPGRVRISEGEIYSAVEQHAKIILDQWECACVLPRMKIVEYLPYNQLLVMKMLLKGKDPFYKILKEFKGTKDYQYTLHPLKCTGIIKRIKTIIANNKFA
ncbi:hypothetical protein NEFER03_1692 [Nematocida sp. LUAm3]|nr:hypothetical protein NEFER03_1692 [Nematocida sp. LUAm3]KAI5175682.1 hypothetical protein NEFER02_1569 [Nematocida sp. LUAm2]KAI5178588.1 hypothetical protein NEFER01_1724 [Nematocida sp. LUAm1]